MEGAAVAVGTGVGVGAGEKSPPFPRNRALAKIRANTTATTTTKTLEIRSSMCTARSEAVCACSGAAASRRPDATACSRATRRAGPRRSSGGCRLISVRVGSRLELVLEIVELPVRLRVAGFGCLECGLLGLVEVAGLRVGCLRGFRRRRVVGRAPVGLGHRCVITPWCRDCGRRARGPGLPVCALERECSGG